MNVRAALACALFLVVAVNQPKSSKEQRVEKQNQRGTDTVGSAANLQHANKAAHPADKAEKKTQDKPASNTKPVFSWKGEIDPTALISILTLFVTGAFLYYTIRTWREMARANDLAEKAQEAGQKETEQSLDLTRKGQEDTRRAVTIAEDQLFAILSSVRATVVADYHTPFDLADATTHHETNHTCIHLKNTGLTPAVNVRPCVTMELNLMASPGRGGVDTSTPSQEMIEAWLKTAGPPQYAGTLATGETRHIHIPIRTLSPEQQAAVYEGTHALCIFGYVLYEDVFRIAHRTNFSMQLIDGGWQTTDKYAGQT